MAIQSPWTLHAIDRFDVFLGFNQHVPEASWFPLICEVENQGPVFSGAIQVSSGGFTDGAVRVFPIELPTGTTKRITIPVFFEPTFGGGWDARLVDAKGREVEARQIQPVRNIKLKSVFLGSISRDDFWTPPLQKLKLDRTELAPVSARLLPHMLPDNPIVLDGLDALYLNSERVTDLRESQQEAIEHWTRMGGHLIVAAEAVSDINSSPWLRRLVPARLMGVTTVEAHPELQAWLRSPVKGGPEQGMALESSGPGVESPSVSRPFADRQDHLEFEVAKLQVAVAEPTNGRVLVASGGQPLIIQRPYGMGHITLLTFSPEREPFRSWNNLPSMWSRLVEVPAEWYASTDYTRFGGWSVDGVFGAMIDSRQIRKLPVGWLLLLLLAYLAVIGPFDRWWLRKIGKPMLTWVTFPLYVVLFSGLIYLIGYKLRAGEREWNELHVVDVVEAGRRADLRGRTYGSLYSPVNDTYRLRGPQEQAAFRGEAGNAWTGGSRSDRMQVLQRDGSFESEAYVPVWTSQLFVNRWRDTGDAPVKVKLSPGPGGVMCQVENTSEHDLSGVRLVLRGRVYDLGDLAAGRSDARALTPANGVALPEALNNLGASRYPGIVQQRGRAFGGTTSGRIEDLAEGCFVASFLDSMEQQSAHQSFEMMPGLDLTGVLEDSAILVALSEGHTDFSPMNLFKTTRGEANTFWRVAVPLNPQR